MDLSNGELAITDGVSNGSYNTYYADYGYEYSGSGYVTVRSGYGASSYGGVGYLVLDYGPSYVSGAIGSRLLYKGSYEEI